MRRTIIVLLVAIVLLIGAIAGGVLNLFAPKVTAPESTPEPSAQNLLDVMFEQPGNYSEAVIYRNGSIKAQNVKLQNATFSGDLTITADAADSIIELDNVAVLGKLIVEGGGSVAISSSKIALLHVYKPGTIITVDANTKVDTVEMQNTNRMALHGAVDTLQIMKDTGAPATIKPDTDNTSATLTVYEGAKLNNLIIDAKAMVSAGAYITRITLGGDAAGTVLNINGADKLDISARTDISTGGSIRTAVFTGGAGGSTLDITGVVRVDTLAADVGVSIKGEGALLHGITNVKTNIAAGGSVQLGTISITEKPVIKGSTGNEPANVVAPVLPTSTQKPSSTQKPTAKPTAKPTPKPTLRPDGGSRPTARPTPTAAPTPSLWNGQSLDTDWYTSTATTYKLTSAAQLNGLAYLVNNGTIFTGKTIRLDGDVDLNNKTWTPIGSSTYKFNGTFDGGGHTVSGMIGALFGPMQGTNVNQKAAIKNLKLTTSAGGAVCRALLTGAIARYVEFQGITINGTINAPADYGQVAGAVWAAIDCTFKNCTNNAALNVSFAADLVIAGGIVAQLESNVTPYLTNGYAMILEGCRNNGRISVPYGQNGLWVGHIFGTTAYDNSAAVYYGIELKNCTRGGAASISVTGSKPAHGYVSNTSGYGIAYEDDSGVAHVTKTNKVKFFGILGRIHENVHFKIINASGTYISPGESGERDFFAANGAWNGTQTSTYWYDSRPDAAAYAICYPAQLAGLAKLVNEGSTNFEGKTITLAADMDLKGWEWTPIGRMVSRSDADLSKYQFKGAFNGGGHTISNLKINKGTLDYAGLFGLMSDTGSVANLTLNGVNIAAQHYVGAVAAGYDSASNGIKTKITDVTVKNAVITGARWIGGVVGGSRNIVITGCTAHDISIVCNVKDGDNGDKVGGILGWMGTEESQVSGCKASNITLCAYRDVGGIVGCYAEAASYANITNNAVTGKLNITVDKKQTISSPNDTLNAGIILGRCIGTFGGMGNSSAATAALIHIGVDGAQVRRALPDIGIPALASYTDIQ
ncbi:MAG: hypothetical protein RRZ71_05110 [Clostridia bacterium]